MSRKLPQCTGWEFNKSWHVSTSPCITSGRYSSIIKKLVQFPPLNHLYLHPSFGMTPFRGDHGGKSKFSEHVLNEGREMKTIEETVSIIHLENNHRKINTLEEIEILKAAYSKYLLNDVIAGQKDSMFNVSPHQWFELQDEQHRPSNKKKFRNPTTEVISDFNYKCQLPKPGDRRNFSTLEDLLKMSR